MTGRHLLIVAHGSRRQASNDEVHQLADRVSAQKGGNFDGVAVAFLELAEPSIPEGLKRLAGQGADQIVVLPYFLAAGTHVFSDIPDAIESFKTENPSVRVSLAPHFGAARELVQALLNLAEATWHREFPT